MIRQLSRRSLVALVVMAPAARSLGQPPAEGPRRGLRFAVWRNGTQIGRHSVAFEGDGAGFRVVIQAEMRVKFGPIPVFNYHHEAQESWRDGRFAGLQSRTTTNGRQETVSAIRGADGVSISRGAAGAPVEAATDAHPLTHWNAAVLEGPLFNPQTGALVHERVARSAAEPLRLADGRSVSATRYALTGPVEITDWYDEAGTWVALKGKAPDGSTIEYRREG